MKIAFLVPDDRDEFRRHTDPTPFFGPAPTALLQGFSRRKDCEIHIVCCIHKQMTAPAKLASNIYYHPLIVPKSGWMRGAYIGCVRAIRNKLREIHPDIVHGQGTERYCAIAAADSGYPNVVTIHGNMIQLRKISSGFARLYFTLAARLEKIALRKTNGVFCNSNYTESIVSGRTRKTWLVANAIRDEFFAPLPVRQPNAVPQLLCVGTIIPYKRQLQILDIAAALHDRGLRFRLNFLGAAGSAHSYYRNFIERIRDAESIGYAKFGGSKSLLELIREFDAASALIHCPSEESFGLVVAEALARNLKCFALGPGGMADILRDTESGELFADGKWDALGDSIASWLQRGAPQPSREEAIMRARYHPDVIADQHHTIYREILGQTAATNS